MNDNTLPSDLSTPATPAFADPWEALSAAPDTSTTSAWLDAPADTAHQLAGSADATASGLQLHRLWDGSLPVESWINQGLGWVVEHFRPSSRPCACPSTAR